MVRIQLEDGYLEVKEGSDFPLNFGVAEIRDLTARSGTFSKSIKLVDSDVNNKLLNHYYDVNIESGDFDINALTTCSVIQNGLPILEDCYLQLVSVDKVQRDNGHEEGIEYTVVVKDSQADFFTVLNNKELTDIDLTDLNHTYNSTEVTGSFTHTSVDGFMYPLMFTPTNALQLTDFKPAVFAKTFFDRIHSTNGFSYTWSSLSDDNFDKCVIPFNGDSFPEQDYDSYDVLADKSSFTAVDGDTVTNWTETQDDESLFNPVTGVYTVPFYVSPTSSINFRFTFDLDFDLVNGTGANAYLVDLLSTGSPITSNSAVQLRVFNGTTLVGVAVVGNSEFITPTDNPLPNGTTTIDSFSVTVDASVSNVQQGDTLTFEWNMGNFEGAFLSWKDGSSITDSDVAITSRVNVTSLDMESSLSVNLFGFGQTVNMNEFIPRKIKQKDFIKSICTMFNLIVEPDKDNPNKLIYKTRDTFYDEGATKDWTLKLAKDVPQELEFLPDLSNKKILFTYKQDQDSENQVYEEATKEIYGQVEYTFSNDYVKGVDKKELIFSPTPMVWNTFSCVVPAINAAAPKTNIRILLHNSTNNCDSYTITNYTGNVQTASKYPHVSHFDDHFNPTFDINFAPCDYYFYQPIFALTNNNLFNNYWRRTISQVNSGKMLTAYFDLNEGDIQTLKLSDKIRIDNSYWHINKIADYNPNKEQKTKVELISVDEEIDLPDFVTKNVIADPIQWIKETTLNAEYYKQNNNNSGDSTIYGVGNTVLQGVKAFVIGDNGFIDEDGFWLNGVKIGDTDTTTTTTDDITILETAVDVTVDLEVYDAVIADASGITITLPDTALATSQNKRVWIKNYSTGIITIDSNSTPSDIDGNTSVTLNKYEAVTLISTKDRYYIV